MLEYIVLGTGACLVITSVIYTRSVDKRIKRQMEEIEFNRGKYDPYLKPEPDQKKVTKAREQVDAITSELDELIDGLRDKELEVKDLVQRVKGWSEELSLSTPKFTEILNQVAAQKEQPVSKANIDEVEQLHKAQEGLLAPSKSLPPLESLPKHDQILRLAQEGRSVEEIAHQLNMGYREVDLIVKLKQKGARNGA